MKKQAIVIPCYNRPDTLERLLRSLDKASYNVSIDLVLSIDYSGSNSVYDVCDKWLWNHGKKIVIKHKTNIGLRSNILYCGNLLLKDYDRIILLEDDLVVSIGFCEFALNAADYYENDTNIAGISLFSYSKSEEGIFNFYPQTDELDSFFIQWPSSWGQLWTRKQWLGFTEWLNLDYNFDRIILPDSVKRWQNSWKKYYAAYLVECNKYFVYPYYSYTQVGSDIGVHSSKSEEYSLYNNSLTSRSTGWKFRGFNNSNRFKYDCFFQPISESIMVKNTLYTVDYDFYGTKDSRHLKCDYVVTAKISTGAIISYGGILIPFEENVRLNQLGSMFTLMDRNTFKNATFPYWKKIGLRMELTKKEMGKLFIDRIISKITGK